MRRLVVALDYGTSNSGASYAIIHDEDKRSDWSDDIEVIKDWPRAGASRDASEKVPSAIAYRDGRPVGHGFQAFGHNATPLQWVKLLLEPDSFKEQSNRTSRVWSAYHIVGSKALEKGPVDVVGDYLRWLWKRTQAVILEKESEDEDTELFQPAHLTVVLTVPASWSAPAKQRMASAAVIAGIPEQCLKPLAEPEAAAVYGLKRKARQRAVGDGDCVIICDAGGGTVDAVAYQVRSREPLSLDQRTVSKGDFCGSWFVNKEFKSQLRSIMGDKYDMLDQQGKDRIDEEFEYTIKRAYNPFDDPNGTYSIPVDGLEDDDELGIDNGRMRIDGAVIFAAFDSVMTQIMALIDAQIDELRTLGLHDKLKGLLLVGGFGKSGFLRARIRQEFPGRKDLKVWASDDSWTAVVRGAVACEASRIGQQTLIHSRLSSYNYGIPFLQGGERKVHWLVRKGQSVRSNMCTEPYGLRIDDQPWLDQDENCLVYVPIVSSSDDDAGGEYTETVTPHAEIKCRVPTDLRFKPGSKEIQVLPAKAWHIPATLVLYFDGALISFRCQIEGREVGVAEVRYLKDEADCITEEDVINDSGSSVHSAIDMERHIRADSKISFLSGSSSGDSRYAQMPSELRHASAPAALTQDSVEELAIQPTSSRSSRHTPKLGNPIWKDTAPDPEPSSPLALSQTKRKMSTFTLRTKRDSPQDRHSGKFLGPSPLVELPPEERLKGVYQRGWAPRKK